MIRSQKPLEVAACQASAHSPLKMSLDNQDLLVCHNIGALGKIYGLGELQPWALLE